MDKKKTNFEELLKLSERLIENDFSEQMWRSGYADLDAHPVDVGNIAQFGDDALKILHHLIDNDHLPMIVIEGVEKNRAGCTAIMKKLLCFLAAIMKISPKNENNTLSVVLSSACFYLRLVPLSKQLALGFSLFQKHIYLSLIDSVKELCGNQPNNDRQLAKFLKTTLQSFAIFINETPLYDTECIKSTSDFLCRLAFSDTADLSKYVGGTNSVGILTLEETDITSLGIGSCALYCIGAMVRRYSTTEGAAASIVLSFIPLLLCVDDVKRSSQMPDIVQSQARQSDVLADFLAHLCSDMHFQIPVANVIQQLIDRAPEKASYRERVVKVCIRLARCLTSTSGELGTLIEWTVAYGKSNRAGSRVVAIELLHSLRTLCSDEPTLIMIVRHFLSRASDSSSNVRVRALALLNDCLVSLSQSKPEVSTVSRQPSEVITGSNAMDIDSETRSSVGEPGTTTAAPRLEMEMIVLQKAICLADDPRVHVRRSALVLLESVLPMIAPLCVFVDNSNAFALIFRKGYQTCAQRCVDCSLLVRNQAARTTTEVLTKTMLLLSPAVAGSNDLAWLGKIWCSSVLPLVSDSEQRIQERVVEFIVTVAIPSMAATEAMSPDQQLCWSVLNTLAIKSRSWSGYYRTGLTLFVKAKTAGTAPRISASLKAAAETIERSGDQYKTAAWFLVGEITAALGAASESQRAVAILDRLSPASKWLELMNQDNASMSHMKLTTLECILGVLAAQVQHSPNTVKNVKQNISDDLSTRLCRFGVHSTLIRPMCTVLFLLIGKQSQKTFSNLINQLLNMDVASVASDKARRCLATVGCLGELIIGTSNQSKQSFGRIPDVTDAVFAKIIDLAQNQQTNELVRAQCLFAIGQLCVADRSSAIRYAPVIGGFLNSSDPVDKSKQSVLVRMAAMSVLADWCMWHTSVAEPYVEHMAACLRDDEPLVRKHALGVIGRLLDGSFIRWHDALFFRFVTTVIDEDPAIRVAATRYFETIVLPREKRFFLRKFIEAILHFNGYVGARIGQTLSQSQSLSSQSRSQEKQLATMAVLMGLSGDSNRKRRFGIYRYMIDAMGSAEERLALARRLIDNVLLAAVREEISLTNQIAGEAVIRDACLILSDERMQFAKFLSSGSTGEDFEDEMIGEEETAADRHMEGRRKIFAKAVKHVIVKELLPAILSVRAFVERVKPSLLGHVYDLLVAAYGEYKAEISDALADDPELLRELEFHMRQAQQQMKERTILAAVTNQQNLEEAAVDQDRQAVEEGERETPATNRELPTSSSPANTPPDAIEMLSSATPNSEEIGKICGKPEPESNIAEAASELPRSEGTDPAEVESENSEVTIGRKLPRRGKKEEPDSVLEREKVKSKKTRAALGKKRKAVIADGDEDDE